MLKGTPAVMPAKDESVSSTALATAKAVAARMIFENCMMGVD